MAPRAKGPRPPYTVWIEAGDDGPVGVLDGSSRSRSIGRSPRRSQAAPSRTTTLHRARRTLSVPFSASPSRIRPGTRSSIVRPSITGGLNDTCAAWSSHTTSSGRSLAFGPGHITGTALPGERGNSVISAHRDTHFTFLRDVRYGDELSIENARGEVRRYRVTGIAITDKSNLAVLRGTGAARLTLVTCYPFNAISAVGPLRYVVTAERLEGAGAI